MEKKKLESAKQEILETTIDIVQAAQLKIILDRLLWKSVPKSVKNAPKKMTIKIMQAAQLKIMS